ncbi:MAG: YceI family protein [Bacteroidetes bacterium]|nr:YceI family protein [Bacteroidota bacterium]
MKKIKFIILFVLMIFASNSFAQTTTWNIDPVHSKIGFRVRHLIISEVEGRFKSFEGSVTTDKEDFNGSKIVFSLDARSVFTDNTRRDNDLKSANFFDAEKYPEITFKSTSFEKVEGNKYKLEGNFTIKGITNHIIMDVIYGGTIKDPWGNMRAGFKITGKINRFDYNLKWNKLLEAGGAVVGKEITITCNIEVIKQK